MTLATQAQLDVVRLSPHIGAEVRNIDLRETLDPDTIDGIRRAWLDHAVILFRDQDLSQEDLLRVNRLMTVGVVDMPQSKSEPLLNAVFDHSEKPEFVYSHVWRKGDLLVWDNRCSMHARTDFPSDQRRLMLRTTIKGTERPY
jgi:alpha-ketoglutarate-dependent taurine dioxygenase